MKATKMGAFDFLEKPPSMERIITSVNNALEQIRLRRENVKLLKDSMLEDEMIGTSPGITEVKSIIDTAAATNARVLITGDNGTGKELVARWLHEKSNRADGPFVEVNCAAIPSELIESVLFGHEKGSFTSAIKQRKGDFEQAHNGTIFLDEIGDMSLSAQAKVLRALQENKIMRVGGEKEIPVNVRVIAATNKNMQEEITARNFREDLYHRLSVILIHVPTLNERTEDIPLLAQHFMELIAEGQGKAPSTFTPEALEELKKFHYTGNIRELRNIIERLAILCGPLITAEDVRTFAQPFR